MNTPDYSKLIDCAAIQMPDGRIWTGKRHHHCIMTIVMATGKKPVTGIQGFVTKDCSEPHPQGRFVTREEARRLCVETGQVTKFCHPDQLFSEDLY